MTLPSLDSQSGGNGNSSSPSWSHAVSSGAQVVYASLVLVGWAGGAHSVTFDGLVMTNIVAVGSTGAGTIHLLVYRILANLTPGSKPVAWTLANGANYAGMSAAFVAGVATPETNLQTAGMSARGGLTFSVANPTNGMAVCIDGAYNTAAGAPTYNAGDTIIRTETRSWGFTTRNMSSYQAGSGSTTVGVDGWANTTNSVGAAWGLSPTTAGNRVMLLAARRWQEFIRELKHGLVPPDVLRRRYRELVAI